MVSSNEFPRLYVKVRRFTGYSAAAIVIGLFDDEWGAVEVVISVAELVNVLQGLIKLLFV